MPYIIVFWSTTWQLILFFPLIISSEWVNLMKKTFYLKCEILMLLMSMNEARILSLTAAFLLKGLLVPFHPHRSWKLILNKNSGALWELLQSIDSKGALASWMLRSMVQGRKSNISQEYALLWHENDHCVLSHHSGCELVSIERTHTASSSVTMDAACKYFGSGTLLYSRTSSPCPKYVPEYWRLGFITSQCDNISSSILGTFSAQ
jgi:hypothetical protein